MLSFLSSSQSPHLIKVCQKYVYSLNGNAFDLEEPEQSIAAFDIRDEGGEEEKEEKEMEEEEGFDIERPKESEASVKSHQRQHRRDTHIVATDFTPKTYCRANDIT